MKKRDTRSSRRHDDTKGQPEQSGAAGEGPRERVRAHLRALLGQVAAAGMAATACAGPGEPPMVCDPLPPPIRCDANMGAAAIRPVLSIDVRWAKVGADLGVSVDVGIYTRTQSLAFSADPTLRGGTLASKPTRQPTRLELTLTPNPGVKAVEIEMPMACEAKATPIVLKLDVSGAREAGGTLPYEVTDPPAAAASAKSPATTKKAR